MYLADEDFAWRMRKVNLGLILYFSGDGSAAGIMEAGGLANGDGPQYLKGSVLQG